MKVYMYTPNESVVKEIRRRTREDLEDKLEKYGKCALIRCVQMNKEGIISLLGAVICSYVLTLQMWLIPVAIMLVLVNVR